MSQGFTLKRFKGRRAVSLEFPSNPDVQSSTGSPSSSGNGVKAAEMTSSKSRIAVIEVHSGRGYSNEEEEAG